MKTYHKIQTVFKRDPATKMKTLIEGDYSLDVFDYLKNCEWMFTEKVDGMNIRVLWDGENIDFHGKTDRAMLPPELFKRLQALFPFSEHFIDKFGREGGVCLYGEGFGPKIQKGGGNYGPAQDFVLFDVNIGGTWLEQSNVRDIAGALNINHVPVIGKGTLAEMVEMAREGILSKWGNFQAEGIVARPSIGLRARDSKRIITKIKCRDFRKGGK